jgi:hypothetical protein
MYRLTSSEWLRSAARSAILMAVAVCLIGASAAEAKKWYYGIGTGFSALWSKGDEGINVRAANIGPMMWELDLSPGDFMDAMESAIGVGGYVTDGTWMVQYSIGQLKLSGDAGTTRANSVRVTGEWNYDILSGEVTVGYPVYRDPEGKVTVRPLVGARYLSHDIGGEVTVMGQTTQSASQSQDFGWTDALAGVTVDVAITPKVSWGAGVNAGFGGSNGTYTANTSVAWNCWRSLALVPNAYFMAVDYENGSQGDSDWYYYDANEWGAGLSVLVNF